MSPGAGTPEAVAPEVGGLGAASGPQGGAPGLVSDLAQAEAYGWRLGRRAGAAVLVALASSALVGAWGVGVALTEPLDEGNRHAISAPLALAQAGASPEVLRRAVAAEAPYAGEGVAYLEAPGRLGMARGAPAPWLAPWPEGISDQGSWRVLRVRLAGGGELRAVHDRSAADRAWRWTALALALAVPLGLLLALLLGRRVARAAAGPFAQALARERRVVRDLGHELRTPLAIVRAHAELALQGESPEEGRRALRTVVEQAQHLADFAEELLGLSRLEAGQAGPAQRVALGELVEAQVEALAPLARAQGQEWRCEGLEQMAWVRAELAMLVRAIANLLDNAWKHGAKPGVVEVHLLQGGGWVELKVRNGGPLLSSEELSRLGERFYRPEASRLAHPSGTGLGLAFAGEVARAAGGGLAWVALPEGGLELSLRLPSAA